MHFISLTLEDLEGAPRGQHLSLHTNLGRELRRVFLCAIFHIRSRFFCFFRSSSTSSH